MFFLEKFNVLCLFHLVQQTQTLSYFSSVEMFPVGLFLAFN